MDTLWEDLFQDRIFIKLHHTWSDFNYALTMKNLYLSNQKEAFRVYLYLIYQ